jgi:hypothetical protein
VCRHALGSVLAWIPCRHGVQVLAAAGFELQIGKHLASTLLTYTMKRDRHCKQYLDPPSRQLLPGTTEGQSGSGRWPDD